MTRYVLDIDLVGSTVTEVWEATDPDIAMALAALAHPGARSITTAGIDSPVYAA